MAEVCTDYFDSVDASEVPDVCEAAMIHRGRFNIDSVSQLRQAGDFDHLFSYKTPDGIVSFIGGSNKQYWNGLGEYSVQIAETNEVSALVGVGEIRHETAANDGALIASWLETSPEFRHRGLLTRRLLVMGLTASLLMDGPLNSDWVVLDNSVENAWLKLVDSGLAKAFTDARANSRYKLSVPARDIHEILQQGGKI